MSEPSRVHAPRERALAPITSGRFDPLAHPLLWAKPARVELPLAWAGHIPFAMLLVDLLRPRTIVELGTHSGNSYNAFCQAVAALGLATRCYAVDTWEGDPHAGNYGAEVYESLRNHQASRYGHFSTLLKMTFDDALARFEPESVDLLHIDGLHTYEAVRHDFQTWLPKLSDRAVVLFHDTAVQQPDFGVCRFWQELQSDYPSLEFPHCNGLGLLAVGRAVPADLQCLISLDGAAKERFLALMERLGDGIVAESESRLRELESQANALASELLRLRHDADTQRQRSDAAENARAEMLASRSWRLTAPLRVTAGLVRRVLRLTRRPGREN